MFYKITCPFVLVRSHESNNVKFRGYNQLVLTTPFKRKNPLNCKDTTVEIEALNNDKYRFMIISNTLDSTEKQVQFIENISEYISFQINKNERNPKYGNIVVQISWYEFYTSSSEKKDDFSFHRPGISYSVGASVKRNLNLAETDWESAFPNEVLHFYCDGLKAEGDKSKYFHWFLILEYMENSPKYKEMFDGSKLFDEEDQKEIKDVAERMSNNTKKSALLNLLSRTKEVRSAKLLKILKHLGISTYKSSGKEMELTESIVGDIIQKRNTLFHSGTEFDDSVLWAHLFPLVTLVVDRIMKNPNVLNKVT